jgi:hypothetical protein
VDPTYGPENKEKKDLGFFFSFLNGDGKIASPTCMPHALRNCFTKIRESLPMPTQESSKNLPCVHICLHMEKTCRRTKSDHWAKK